MYRALVILAFTVLSSLFRACTEPYYPHEDGLKTGTLVINAHLTNQPGEQVVEISRSAALIHPILDRVSGCLAELIREDGELRIFPESEPGYYWADLDTCFLQTGYSYMLHVTTAEGQEYESDFDKIRPVPHIDSLYYLVETNFVGSDGDHISGIRFYCDFTYDDEDYEYLRWDLTETYEFHNPDLIVYDRSQEIHQICYITNELPTIYSMSLASLEFGTYIKKPFAFVPNDQVDQKLYHKYSLLVKQYSLGPEAFYYWNELQKNSQEQGSLFDRQPALLESNIHNVNDDSELVLGFFSMAGVQDKRGFAIQPEGLILKPNPWYCIPMSEPPGGGNGIYVEAIMYDSLYKGPVPIHCVDCREYRNSTHIKPDFW